MNHFEALGWEQKKPEPMLKNKDAGKNWIVIPKGTPLEHQKPYVAALWQALGYKMSGLDRRCKVQFGVDRFAWLHNESALQVLAKDLNNRCRKKGINPEASL